MIDALDSRGVTERRLEQFEFSAAESLACETYTGSFVDFMLPEEVVCACAAIDIDAINAIKVTGQKNLCIEISPIVAPGRRGIPDQISASSTIPSYAGSTPAGSSRLSVS